MISFWKPSPERQFLAEQAKLDVTDSAVAATAGSATGLRTARRISHMFVRDGPSDPRMLLISDGAIHIYPKLNRAIGSLWLACVRRGTKIVQETRIENRARGSYNVRTYTYRRRAARWSRGVWGCAL